MKYNSERYSQIVKNPKGENDGRGMPINLAQSLYTVYSAELKFQEPCFSRGKLSLGWNSEFSQYFNFLFLYISITT